MVFLEPMNIAQTEVAYLQNSAKQVPIPAAVPALLPIDVPLDFQIHSPESLSWVSLLASHQDPRCMSKRFSMRSRHLQLYFLVRTLDVSWRICFDPLRLGRLR
jgi:hypothetical protein